MAHTGTSAMNLCKGQVSGGGLRTKIHNFCHFGRYIFKPEQKILKLKRYEQSIKQVSLFGGDLRSKRLEDLRIQRLVHML